MAEDKGKRKTPMSRKTKIILSAVAAAVVVTAIVIGIWVVSHKLSQKEYTRYMSEADKYMTEKDYDNAILTYEKAIEAAPKEAEAYEQIASVYMELDKFNQAEYYLNLGLGRVTNSGKLKYLLKKFSQYRENSTKEEIWHDNSEKLELEEEEVTVKVQGTIIDAVTGKGVTDASLTAVMVKGKDGGKPKNQESAIGRTKANGSYELAMAEGEYQITVTAEGYIEEIFEIEVKDKDIKNENFTISPELNEGEIRIVLEWGASPSDLDAYLFKNSLSDQSPVYFGGKGSESKGAELDIDDRNGYGPETITIYDTQSTWIYGVQDYTHTEMGIADSGVTVKVYIPGKTPKIYTAPTGDGAYWTVCKISNGEVTDIDNLGNSFQ